jgi:hypothetical protein
MFFSCRSAFDVDPADYLSGMTNQKEENKMSLRIIYAVALGLSVMSSGVAFAQAGNSGSTGMTGGGGPRNTTGTMNGQGSTGSGTQYNGNAGYQGSGTTEANPPSGTSNEDTPIGSPGGSTTGTSSTGSVTTGSGNVGGSIGGGK